MTVLKSFQELGGYITDITRTWPVSGTFTPAQKDLYNAVLTTQRDCIALCRANANLSLDELHNIAESSLTDHLKQLGFDMSGKVCVLRLLLHAIPQRLTPRPNLTRLSNLCSPTIWATTSVSTSTTPPASLERQSCSTGSASPLSRKLLLSVSSRLYPISVLRARLMLNPLPEAVYTFPTRMRTRPTSAAWASASRTAFACRRSIRSC